MMSTFNDLNKAELFAVGEQFAVDLEMSMKKDDMIKELEESGIDYESYAALLEEAKDEEPELAALDDTPLDEPEPEVKDDATIVVKMTRLNPTYEALGYRFSRDHPFMLVTEEEADFLIEKDGGFQMASPREIREYYAQ